MSILIVAGSRTIADELPVVELLNTHRYWYKDAHTLFEGGAKGPDRIGKIWATLKLIPVREFQPDWKQFGKGAGMMRNQQMAAEAAKEPGSVLFAFWDQTSAGTKEMIRAAKDRGLRTLAARWHQGTYRYTEIFPAPGEAKPKIFIWYTLSRTQGHPDNYSGYAMDEGGFVITWHTSNYAEYVEKDMTNSNATEKYNLRFPNGYEIVYLADHPSRSKEFDAAYRLNKNGE